MATLHSGIAFLSAILLASPLALAIDPPAPVSSPATAPSVQPRDEQAIVTDLRAINQQIAAIMPAVPVVLDPLFRQQNAAKLNPLLRKMTDLFAELQSTQTDEPTRAKIQQDRYLFMAILVTLDDKETTTSLTADAAKKDPVAIPAQSALTLGNWWKNSKDAATQSQILATFAALAKSNPDNDRIAITLGSMSNLGPANEALAKQASDTLRVMTAPLAKEILASADVDQSKKDMVGKPLEVAGRTTTNTKLTTTSLKGKVILVDFWATWCGPCNAEIPRVKDLYKTYHSQGFEIVGVDCDDADDTVNTFTQQKEMPWPQLRELSQSQDQWHPLAKQWHVDGIPTMFLIDKKGVLRYIDAREDTQTKIVQLLAEAAN